MIWQAAHQSTAILENVVLKEGGVPDFHDVSITSNTRAAYRGMSSLTASLRTCLVCPSRLCF